MIENLKIRSIEEDPNRKEIIVPSGIRYISEWNEYCVGDFNFPHILDKKIPGCGYTEYCITNDMNIILCSPRKMLLENKEEQHPNEVFYFKNELENDLEYDKDLTKTKHIPKEIIITSEEKRKQILDNLRDSLRNYVTSCICKNIPAKVLVTYDSFRLVKEFLGEKILNFYTVIDEFQSVLVDSKFKSSTELDFLYQLRDIQNVCYVSATPMIDKYLSKIPEFANLPYYELNWIEEDPLRAIKPDLRVRTTQSIVTTAKGIIDSYLKGNFDNFVCKDSKTGEVKNIFSKEAVFYVNSVNNILAIIKKMDLLPSQCNILCANTPDNRKRVKSKLGSKFQIGHVPLKSEPRKMFTFCTRTVYLGADFYSDNARTFILSDANIDALAVDVSLDLPQIIGRQRLNENPWKNRAEFWYKTLRPGNVITQEEFDAEIEKKSDKTESLLRAFSEVTLEKDRLALAEKYEKDAKNSNYKDDYVAVNTHGGSVLIPVTNHLVRIAEQRAFDIQQIDYKDRFTVFNTMKDRGFMDDEVVQRFLFDFENLQNFPAKMKKLCEDSLKEEERCVILDQIPLTYKNFYLTLGPKRCRANGYDISRIKKEYNDLSMDKTDLINRIESEFIVGERYTMPDIKDKLKEIYSLVGYNKSPKATDLSSYFEIRKCDITSNGKRSKAFEILAKK